MALYDNIGRGYAASRRSDPRIAALIDAALGDAVSVVNVGAGSGSYEPSHRTVLAVEPSETMIRQRPAPPLAAPCVQASAEALPLEAQSFDAAMAILTVHHWTDLEQGFREMARVARRRVVLLTWVPDAAPFWLTDEYFPEIAAHDRAIFPCSDSLAAMLERTIGPVRMTPVPIPHDCVDGFLCAYWRRPECYLRADIRSGMSSFARIDAGPGITRLATDLSSGRWADLHGHLLNLSELDAGYRLVVCEIRDRNA